MASVDPLRPVGAPGLLLQIGEVAERVGLSLRTLRYWEEIGLVTPSARSEGRFRLYSEADVERLLLIKGMKPLGLSLDEMGELADLIDAGAVAAHAPSEELVRSLETLAAYAARADKAITKVERQLAEAWRLRLRIGEQLGRYRAAVEQGAPPPR